MVVLNGKRIVYIITCLMITFMVFIINSDINQNYTMPVSAVPVSGHTIILDAGHGEPDGGAVSNNGTSEEEINLRIVLKLQELLEASGCNVILTRSDEKGIYDLDSDSLKNKKKSDLKNRVEIANSEKADIFISIHLNKLDNNEVVHGWQSFYQKNSEESKKLAGFIQENLNYSIQKDNKRNIMTLSGKYVMDNVKIPTVTIECGFLSNEEEVSNLKKDAYQDRLAWGIYCGTMDYFK